ncbi:MAG: hypothetical protein E7570_00040 [Ruminococcaceae bacterium]|nr:hypothetical protein [Oscillospiraceae bacterium]
MLSVVATIMSLAPFVLILLGLALTVITDSYISKNQKHLMLAILTLTFVLVAQNSADYYFVFGNSYVMQHIIAGVIGYTVRPAIIALFFSILNPDKRNIFAWVLVGINALLYISDLLIPGTFYTFTYTDNNVFVRGSLGYVCHIVSGILLALLVLMIIKLFADDRKQMVLPFFSTLLIVFAVWVDTVYNDMKQLPLSALTMAIVVSCVFYFLWIHNQLVNEHEKDLMAQQQVKLMITQIQPHFLYNTLSTIQALCLTNPEEASDITGKFGKYLRQNLDLLEQSELIPLESELEHTRIYAEIEKVRFPNISVVYDINYSNFMLPALSIQPLVENAIRHGIRNLEHGIVEVKTEKTKQNIIITIKDNGKGFDAQSVDKSENHIGISNVKERIEKICVGTLDVQSVIGKGTTVVITIPKGERE